MRDIKPSERAFARVRKMAREAAKTDNWLTVELDDLRGHDDLALEHRAGWEQTCHWEHYYGSAISTIADSQARRFGELSWEEQYWGLYDPLKDAFWETWEEAVGFWEAVNERETADAT